MLNTIIWDRCRHSRERNIAESAPICFCPTRSSWAPGSSRSPSGMRASPLHACATQWERSGHNDHERAVEDQGQTRSLGNALSSWEHFFCEDQNGKHCHRCDIHHAQGEEEDKEQPVRSQTIDAVLQAQTKGASVAVTKGPTDELQRRAAFCQADALEGGELIEPGYHEGAAADPSCVQHDPRNLPGQSRGGERAEIG